MTLIIETKAKQVKNPNTKTTYLTQSIKKSLLTEREYNLTVKDDTLKWFRQLGGTETAQRSYTLFGYVPYKLTSVSPDRQNKTVREFQFIAFDWDREQLFKELFKNYDDGLFYLKRFKGGKTLTELKQILNSKVMAQEQAKEIQKSDVFERKQQVNDHAAQSGWDFIAGNPSY
tara:strand:+ start:2792 stop:3310 length:519 start_codon:yes stop_codon:yes gene_type:complete